MIVCFSRCLICGRRTSHECCHRHSLNLNGTRFWPSSGPSGGDFNRNQSRMWSRHFNDDPEVCEDPKCPAALRVARTALEKVEARFASDDEKIVPR